MKPIYEAWCIQIEVTNACPNRCAHCTRAVRHVRKPYFMSLEEIDRALESLKGWPKVVGCMGGEPTIHPQFEEVCLLYQKHFPRHQCGLWTSGGPAFEKHRKVISETFGKMLYNDHSEVGKHQPFLLAIEETVDDERLRNELIEKCWVQRLWSPSINTKGAFFCEIAAVIDLLFDGPGGYCLNDAGDAWWRKTPAEFHDQVDRYCRQCGMAIPFKDIPNDISDEYVSSKNRERLLKVNSPWADKLKVVESKLSLDDIKANLKDYAPWEYLGESGTRDKKGKVKPGYAKKRDHTPISPD